MGAAMLALQRAAGNQAVTAALRRGPPASPGPDRTVQRRNLLQALSPEQARGIRAETYQEWAEQEFPDPKEPTKTVTFSVPTGRVLETKRNLVVSPGGLSREVKVFSRTAEQKPASRLAALQAAAAQNASLGQLVDAYAASVGLAANPNAKWTPHDKPLNDDAAKTVDPFFFEVTVGFEQPRGTPQVIDLIYQHAKEFTGYVEAIYDSTNDPTRDLASMHDVGEDVATARADPNVRNPKYSNVHAVDERPGAPKLIDLTAGGAEVNLDAYTKIAGEGARWQCVAQHAAELKDSSVFYVDDPRDASKVRGVTFRQLWLSWIGVFDKKYGIPDATVAAAILGGEFEAFSQRKYHNTRKCGAGSYWRSDLVDGRDYDLVASRAHQEPFDCVHTLGPALRPMTSYFVTRDDRGRGWLGVGYGALRAAWHHTFARAARVDDAAVEQALLAGRFGRDAVTLAARDMRRGTDYNLVRGAPW